MNPDVLARAQEIALGVITNVTPDQLELPTPCEKWKVGDVIAHVTETQHWARSLLQGETPEPPTVDGVTGDVAATFAGAASQSFAAFSEDGALERIAHTEMGDMPAAVLLGILSTDTFTHAWDVAVATGQDTDLDPELAAQLLEGARQTIPPAFRSEDGAIFRPEQAAPAGADAATQLAAFLGRTV